MGGGGGEISLAHFWWDMLCSCFLRTEPKHSSLEGKRRLRRLELRKLKSSECYKIRKAVHAINDGQGRGDCLEELLTHWTGAPGCSSWVIARAGWDLLVLLSWSCPCSCKLTLPWQTHWFTK